MVLVVAVWKRTAVWSQNAKRGSLIWGRDFVREPLNLTLTEHGGMSKGRGWRHSVLLPTSSQVVVTWLFHFVHWNVFHFTIYLLHCHLHNNVVMSLVIWHARRVIMCQSFTCLYMWSMRETESFNVLQGSKLKSAFLFI